VKKDGQKLTVSYLDKIIRERMDITPDLLVLSAATLPRDTEDIASVLKLPRTPGRLLLEATLKLRPVDFASDGMYLAGGAHGPKLITETLSQASAAAARACTILSKEKMMVGGLSPSSDGDRCAACLTCVRVCPYEVPVINIEGARGNRFGKMQGLRQLFGRVSGESH